GDHFTYYSFPTRRSSDLVLDPFAGSGTTLVQALESGLHATGVELAAFNCLLIGVKTSSYDVGALDAELRDAYGRLDSLDVKRRSDRKSTRLNSSHLGISY